MTTTAARDPTPRGERHELGHRRRRWRAGDVRSILATNGSAPIPTPAGQALVMTLPTVPTRSLDAYAINAGDGGNGGDPA